MQRTMKHVLTILACAILGLLQATSQLHAQSQAMNGVVEGTIRADNGLGLAGVMVGLKNQDNGAARSLQTDNTGRYRAPLLPLGNYEITAQREGFVTGRQGDVYLGIGQTKQVSFTLRRTPTVEAVSVKTRTPLIDADRKQPSTVIDTRFVENLPLYGRKFMDLGVMVPGATEFGDRDTSATGDFSGVNHFYSNAIVDGTYSYQAWSGLPNGKFLVPFEYSENAIQEFQILNGNFTAEFGRSAGGLVNAVTKSGTNELHGNASYLFSDSAMNARPRFAFTKPQTRQQQFGGSLGGPLKVDKLFLFGNYEQQVRREPMIVIPGTVLDGFDTTLASITNPDERQRFTQAGDFVRSLTGDFDRSLDQYTFLTRTDWRPNATHSLSARFNYQKFHATNVPENGFNAPIISGMAVSNNGKAGVENNSLALQWSVAFSPQTLNEARMQFALGKEEQTANADGPQVRIGSGRTGINFGRRDVFPLSLREQRWQWVDTLTLVRGRHEIKTGVDIDRVVDRNTFLQTASGFYQFNNLRDFANSRYMTYTQGFGVPEDSTLSPYYGAFVQDNVKLTPTLSMNAGLRYEFQDLKAASISNPLFPRTAQVRDDKNNFAPRLAFAWQPRERLVVRSSYGVYYGLLSVQANSVAKTQNGVLQNVREFRPTTAGAPTYPQILASTPTPQTPTAGSRIIVFSPDFASPYIQQVNLEIEREVADNLSISSGWLYTKGTRLRSNEEINLFPPGTRAFQINDTSRNISGVFDLPSFGGPASRPYPFFDQISEFRSDNNSVYHAFYVQMNKRYGRGLQFLFNYTLSKLIDRGQAPGNQITCCTSDNAFNPGDERALGRRDQRNRVNLAAVWDLPSVSTGNAFTKSVLRGWRVNTIVKAGSGRPFTAVVTGDSGGDVNGDAIRGDRAPLLGRSTFIGPGYATVDLALHRLFFTRERKSLDFGFEAFNLFNRANYLRPAPEYFTLTNVPGGISRLEGPLLSFGKPQDATPSRLMQAVIKFSF
jgi:Carboxypeptidase regulatory-like domain/TonB dependent receptor-like, beta-barrel